MKSIGVCGPNSQNADHEQTIPFALPPLKDSGPWERLFDTAVGNEDLSEQPDRPEHVAAKVVPTFDKPYNLNPCSMAVFRSVLPEAAEEPANTLVG